MTVHIARAYESPDPGQGTRILVDRLWPRGLSRQRAAIDLWLREIAPSTELRSWFGHDPGRWDAFRERYARELEANPEVDRLRAEIARGPVCLVYAARDERHNNAVALKEFLERARPS